LITMHSSRYVDEAGVPLGAHAISGTNIIVDRCC
jgi:hypothetical protein